MIWNTLSHSDDVTDGSRPVQQIQSRQSPAITYRMQVEFDEGTLVIRDAPEEIPPR